MRSRALEQSLGLPGEHLVGHALEGLAEHHEAAGLRVARAEVQVAEPPLPAAVAPLGREHDEVEGVRALDLEPARRRAAPPRRARRAPSPSRLRGRARARRRGTRSASSASPVDDPRHAQRLRQALRRAPRAARAAGRSIRSSPSRWRMSKKNARERQLGPELLEVAAASAAEPAHRDLERVRPPVGAQRDRLAVEHRGLAAAARGSPRRSRGRGRSRRRGSA